MTLLKLKDHLNLAQQRMKRQANKKRKDIEFQEGDWVYLKVRPYRQKTLSRKRCEKLSPKFFNPFLILNRIGNVAYRLQLPSEAQIHDVFHGDADRSNSRKEWDQLLRGILIHSY